MADTLDIERLTIKQRLDLIAELWDSFAPEDANLTPAQDAEPARRMTTFDADAKAAIPWKEIDTELSRRS